MLIMIIYWDGLDILLEWMTSILQDIYHLVSIKGESKTKVGAQE
jgi:hypothetical protein